MRQFHPGLKILFPGRFGGEWISLTVAIEEPSSVGELLMGMRSACWRERESQGRRAPEKFVVGPSPLRLSSGSVSRSTLSSWLSLSEPSPSTPHALLAHEEWSSSAASQGMSTLVSPADLPTIAQAVALQNDAKSVALDLLSGAIGVLLAEGNLTKVKKVEMVGSLSTVKDLILKGDLFGRLEDQLQSITTVIQETVNSSVATALSSINKPSFAQVLGTPSPTPQASAPKERFQLLAHDIPTELELDEITTNLEEDNPYLHIDTTSPPRWLLKDLTGK
ncbi:hypothetical protein R1sor_023741 [Riccia sorocarpa]|uniref:Uncharacterized protein n=1 Tax=Riccia sorocarpa TaxID=122646 RepID=A0ABD3GRT8_9MARC